MSAALTVTGLRAGYGSTNVLHGIDLVVPAGAAVALLGANGAGKSTLLKTIAGLLPATSGSVELGGVDVTAAPADARARAGICLLPEGRGIFRNLTVRENLAMQNGSRDVDAAVAQIVARFPRLESRMNQTAGTLSGGEQQMLSLARALSTDPAVVLADELSVGLAPVIVDDILAAVSAMRAEGRSILIVEQYVSRVLALVDYVYLLHKGRVVFVGEPAQCDGGRVFDQYLGATA
jgi:branched-chain amino acid transport system ATP-binding protein